MMMMKCVENVVWGSKLRICSYIYTGTRRAKNKNENLSKYLKKKKEEKSMYLFTESNLSELRS